MLLDGDSYNSLRLADYSNLNAINNFDELSYGGRVNLEEFGWYYLISFSPGLLVRILPFFLGILSFVLFYLLVDKVKPELKFMASLILIVSPTFLYFFSVSTKYLASVFFIILGFYLFKTDKKILSYLSFLLSGFFSIFGLFLVLLSFLFYAYTKKSYKEFSLLLTFFLISFILQFYRLLFIGLPPDFLLGLREFSFVNLISFIIFEFGGKYGFSLFIFVLALIGIYFYYNRFYRFIFIYLVLFFLLLFAFYNHYILFYLSFLMAFFAALAFSMLFKHNWKSGIFKFMTLLVLICGILFSFLVYYNELPNFSPDQNYFQAIKLLKSHDNQDVVFSSYRNADFIKYANKKTFLDENALYVSDIDQRINDFEVIMNSTDLNKTLSYFNNYNVTYILFDKKTKIRYFNNNNEKFMFLLTYGGNYFIPLVVNDDVGLWSINRSVQ
ncbi:hypothetical protein J4216_01535 [Candidatus Woesearchaeota archaeon]|nr:hypothetical protein [Candidatus Woesearchaeota archaeon]